MRVYVVVLAHISAVYEVCPGVGINSDMMSMSPDCFVAFVLAVMTVLWVSANDCFTNNESCESVGYSCT